MQLELPNLEVCRENYDQNTKPVQSEELCPFRLGTSGLCHESAHCADSAQACKMCLLVLVDFSSFQSTPMLSKASLITKLA